MTEAERTPEQELQHWHDALTRVLEASPDLPWPVLIEWAEEDNLVARKAATRAGRAKIVAQEQRLATMEENAAAWQKEAEQARADLVRITDLHAPVQHMGQTWCSECSVRRRTGPKTEEWVAYIPHPCPTLDALDSTRETESSR